MTMSCVTAAAAGTGDQTLIRCSLTHSGQGTLINIENCNTLKLHVIIIRTAAETDELTRPTCVVCAGRSPRGRHTRRTCPPRARSRSRGRSPARGSCPPGTRPCCGARGGGRARARRGRSARRPACWGAAGARRRRGTPGPCRPASTGSQTCRYKYYLQWKLNHLASSLVCKEK